MPTDPELRFVDISNAVCTKFRRNCLNTLRIDIVTPIPIQIFLWNLCSGAVRALGGEFGVCKVRTRATFLCQKFVRFVMCQFFRSTSPLLFAFCLLFLPSFMDVRSLTCNMPQRGALQRLSHYNNLFNKNSSMKLAEKMFVCGRPSRRTS